MRKITKLNKMKLKMNKKLQNNQYNKKMNLLIKYRMQFRKISLKIQFNFLTLLKLFHSFMKLIDFYDMITKVHYKWKFDKFIFLNIYI